MPAWRSLPARAEFILRVLQAGFVPSRAARHGTKKNRWRRLLRSVHKKRAARSGCACCVSLYPAGGNYLCEITSILEFFQKASLSVMTSSSTTSLAPLTSI